MGTKGEKVERSIEHALAELEGIADEIRVKLHLAGMDANVAWNEKLEPKLRATREHAKDAAVASKKVIDDTIEALRTFSSSL